MKKLLKNVKFIEFWKGLLTLLFFHLNEKSDVFFIKFKSSTQKMCDVKYVIAYYIAPHRITEYIR